MTKILIVDDDEDVRFIIQDMINSGLDQKVEFTEAENGKVGLEKIAQSSYDLIILDHKMPVLNGFETFKAIKKDKNSLNYTTPAIIMSGYLHDFINELTMYEGEYWLVDKPPVESKFIYTVKLALNSIKQAG